MTHRDQPGLQRSTRESDCERTEKYGRHYGDLVSARERRGILQVIATRVDGQMLASTRF